MALILIIIIFIIIRMYLLTNVNTIPSTSASMFRVYKCTCVIKFHLGKWRPIRDQIFVVVETVFFHSI